MAKVAERYGVTRSVEGAPSGFDFLGGPLAAALLEFSNFDDLPEAAGPTVRTLNVVDPFFGVLVFTAVRVGEALVEIADFVDAPTTGI